LPFEQIQVTAPDVGGGFGMKNFVYPEWVLVLWAARRLGRPVKWVADRAEEFVSGTQGRDNHTMARLALDVSGRFLALQVPTVANLGAICRRTARAVRPTRRRRRWAASMQSLPFSWMCAAPSPIRSRSTLIAAPASQKPIT
jgi:CO/xanthine dehydrogenase Mo-binding subunit